MNGRPWIYAERLHLLRVSADVPTFKIMNYESLYHIQGQRLSSCEPTHWVKRFCNDHILILINVHWCNLWPTTPTTLSETNSKSTWKIYGWKMMFFLWWPIFKDCDSFRERNDRLATSNPMGETLGPKDDAFFQLDVKLVRWISFFETINLYSLYMMTISMSFVWDHAPPTYISASKPTFSP